MSLSLAQYSGMPKSPTLIRSTAATYSAASLAVHCPGLVISGCCCFSQRPVWNNLPTYFHLIFGVKSEKQYHWRHHCTHSGSTPALFLCSGKSVRPSCDERKGASMIPNCARAFEMRSRTARFDCGVSFSCKELIARLPIRLGIGVATRITQEERGEQGTPLVFRPGPVSSLVLLHSATHSRPDTGARPPLNPQSVLDVIQRLKKAQKLVCQSLWDGVSLLVSPLGQQVVQCLLFKRSEFSRTVISRRLNRPHSFCLACRLPGWLAHRAPSFRRRSSRRSRFCILTRTRSAVSLPLSLM